MGLQLERRTFWIFCAGCLALFMAAPSLAAPRGAGDLLVAPTRVVFEGRQRTAEITLVNRGYTPATYRISFVELRMDELGRTTELDPAAAEPGEQFSSSMIRYAPRQVSLAPGVAQTVRLQLRKSEGLTAGEYRSHLLFRAVPEGQLPAIGASTAAALEIKLQAIYGVSIPVIVRQAETEAKAGLDGLAFLPATEGRAAAIRFRILREGNRSLYGNLIATLRDQQGKSKVVGVANGVAVYSPNTSRTSQLELQLPVNGHASGTLRLVYETPEHEILAESAVAVQ